MPAKKASTPVSVICPNCKQVVQCYTLEGMTRISAHYGLPLNGKNCKGSGEVVVSKPPNS